MLDKYISGLSTRVSQEAPVPIVHVSKESFVPGGAANTACNIKALGGEAILIGLIGNDEPGSKVLEELKARNISTDCIVQSSKPTTQKVRIISNDEQLVRVDYEDTKELDDEKLLQKIKENLEVDAVIVSDYSKGTVTKKVMEALQTDKPIIIDPKPNKKELYHGAFLVTPNHREACQMLNKEICNDDGINEIGSALVEELKTNILITRGSKGATLYQKEGKKDIPTTAIEVFDVSGAGDTVVSTLALAIAAGAELEDAAKLANLAAGIVVGKTGTATCSQEELVKAL